MDKPGHPIVERTGMYQHSGSFYNDDDGVRREHITVDNTKVMRVRNIHDWLMEADDSHKSVEDLIHELREVCNG